MLRRFIKRLIILPRWIIIIIDLFIISFSVAAGYALRFNFSYTDILLHNPLLGLTVCVFTALVSIVMTKSYAGIIRYTSLEDGIRLLYTSVIGFTLTGVLNLIYHYNAKTNLIPYPVLFISFFASFLFLFYYRLIVQSFF